MPKPLLVFTVALILASFLATSSFAQGQPVEASLSEKDIAVNISSAASTDLIIGNPQNVSLAFFLTIKGIYPKGILFDNNIIIPPNSTATQKITFNPTGDIGRYRIVFYGENLANPSLNFSIPANLWVQHPDRYIINGVKYLIEGSKAIGYITLKPDDKRQTDLVFDIVDINEKVVKSATLSMEIDRQVTLQQPLDISDLPAGKYRLRVSIKGTSLSSFAGFDIGLSKNVLEEKTVVSGLIFDEVKINLYNKGNLVENDYKVYEDLDKNTPIRLVTNATDIINAGKTVKYEFTVPEIRPGEVATVIYRIDNTPAMLTKAVVAVVILAAILAALMVARKPKIKKKFLKSGHGQYSIILEIRSSKLSGLKDVVIRDIVQPLAKVKKGEFLSGGLTPHIRESQLGTELLWRVGALKRGESRLLHYVLEAALGAESLKLSSATLNYVTKGNGKGSVNSNEIVMQ